MKIGTFTNLLSLSLFLLSCEETPSDYPVLRYYPPSPIFEDGYANKYYEHYEPNNQNTDKLTRISYAVFQKTSEKAFVIKRYNAGFELTGKSYYRMDDYFTYTDSVVSIWREDTTIFDIKKNVRYRWDSIPMDGMYYEASFQNDDVYFQYTSQQTEVYDSIIENKPAKVFVKNSKRIRVEDQDTTIIRWNNKTSFIEGLGYFGEVEKSADYVWKVELMEQIPLSKFSKMADHSKHRIAYIDPKKVLDKEEAFEICGHEKLIADYYNSDIDGGYVHSKRAMLDTIYANVNESKLLNQTGMLTFRFVVNCEGKAGRFITEGYDYDYRPYAFPKETVSHLYGVIRRLTQWNPVETNEEKRDAYFYITFKLSNGEITEILP